MAKEFQVVCINAKNKPSEIPSELWIVENVEVYTVTETSYMARQPGVIGFTLKERDLSSVPNYKQFDSRRFRPTTDDDRKLLAEVKEVLDKLVGEESVFL